jgi:hypothetical protein
MEITGKVVSKMPQQTGQGKNGAWVKQDFIIETTEQYPKKVCISLWGDKVKELESIQIGESIKVSINVESREFNGKWYTDVKGWKMDKAGSAGQPTHPTPPETPSIDEVPPFLDSELNSPENGDLPF